MSNYISQLRDVLANIRSDFNGDLFKLNRGWSHVMDAITNPCLNSILV